MSANPWTSQTDAALFHAEHLLTLSLQNSKHEGKGVLSVRPDSCQAGCWLLLKEAFSLWLKELAHFNQFKEAAFGSLSELEKSEFSGNPEAQYLINLKQEPHSWLGQLFRVTGKDGSVIDAVGLSGKPSQRPANLIAVQVSHDNEVADLQSVLVGFKAYVKDVRARQVEW